jgi:hypothetical protein
MTLFARRRRASTLQSRRPRNGCNGQRDCVHLVRRLEAVAPPLHCPLLCSTLQRVLHATSRGISSFGSRASTRHFPSTTPPHANQLVGTSLWRYSRQNKQGISRQVGHGPKQLDRLLERRGSMEVVSRHRAVRSALWHLARIGRGI